MTRVLAVILVSMAMAGGVLGLVKLERSTFPHHDKSCGSGFLSYDGVLCEPAVTTTTENRRPVKIRNITWPTTTTVPTVTIPTIEGP